MSRQASCFRQLSHTFSLSDVDKAFSTFDQKAEGAMKMLILP